MEISDDRAVELARKGDPDGFRILVDRHSRGVFRLAYRITTNTQEAEDIVQETFLRAYKQLARFDGRAAFATWLHRIAVNCSLDAVRARKRRGENYAPPAHEDGHDDPFRDLADAAPTPERSVQSVQIRELLQRALQDLSDMERCAFTLRHHEGLCIEDIGKALGVQPNAAKHSIFRALKKLRRALEPALDSAKGVA